MGAAAPVCAGPSLQTCLPRPISPASAVSNKGDGESEHALGWEPGLLRLNEQLQSHVSPCPSLPTQSSLHTGGKVEEHPLAPQDGAR